MSELLLQGPFLTRAQAARLAHLPGSQLPDRPDLLHVRGPFLQETYFAFQFDEHGIRSDLARVVHAARADLGELEVADWLVRPSPDLNGTSPLTYLNGSGSVDQVLQAIPRHTAETKIHHTESAPNLGITRERPKQVLRRQRLGFTH